MEQQVYKRQINKTQLSLRVVDDKQTERHYHQSDMVDLYSDVNLSAPCEPKNMPQDAVLAAVIRGYGDHIIRLEDHESLLRNETNENLTEAEQQQAWCEFESERQESTTKELNKMKKMLCEYFLLNIPVLTNQLILTIYQSFHIWTSASEDDLWIPFGQTGSCLEQKATNR